MSEDDLFERIDVGVRLGIARALAERKRSGLSTSEWKDGKIVEIPAEELYIDEEYIASLEERAARLKSG